MVLNNGILNRLLTSRFFDLDLLIYYGKRAPGSLHSLPKLYLTYEDQMHKPVETCSTRQSMLHHAITIVTWLSKNEKRGQYNTIWGIWFNQIRRLGLVWLERRVCFYH